MNLEKYTNIYVTSDLHFGHKNIIKYEQGRSQALNINVNSYIQDKVSKYRTENKLFEITDKQYKDICNEFLEDIIQQHDNMLINNWNNVVTKNDLVFILGDFSFYKQYETQQILKSLNGTKVLVVGNHDKFIRNPDFNKNLFKEITDYLEIKYNGTFIAMMHYPILVFNHQNTHCENRKTGIHLCGHIHSLPYTMPEYSYNVGVDVNNYTPIKLDIAIEKALFNKTGLINGTF